MSLLSSMELSAAGLYAQRTRLNVISSNIANLNTTRTPEGGPYIRRSTVFGSFPQQSFGEKLQQASYNANQHQLSVPKVVGVVEDSRAPLLKYDPSHPDANEQGYVAYPNVNLTEEMVDLIQARRSFEANVVAFNVSRGLVQKSLEIGRQ